MLENCLGSDGLKICNSLTFGIDETKDMKTVIMKLEETCIGELNETYERYMFNLRKQRVVNLSMITCLICAIWRSHANSVTV